jgi:predicted PolB exonuclease-like 3'-5' exonuclease
MMIKRPNMDETLHELCRVMGLPGKPDGMTGAEVEKFYRDGHIREIAEYCESDVSTHTGCGSATNCFAGDCQMPSFGEARPTLWSS